MVDWSVEAVQSWRGPCVRVQRTATSPKSLQAARLRSSRTRHRHQFRRRKLERAPKHPREVRVIRKPRLERHDADAPVPAQERARRQLQSTVAKEVRRRHSVHPTKRPREMHRMHTDLGRNTRHVHSVSRAIGDGHSRAFEPRWFAVVIGSALLRDLEHEGANRTREITNCTARVTKRSIGAQRRGERATFANVPRL